MTAFPPDKWSMHTGTWGTDADQGVDQIYTGESSIKFPSAGSNSAKTQRDYEAMEPLYAHMIEVAVRADSIAAGCVVNIAVETFTAAKVSLGSSTMFNGLLPAANTWYVFRHVFLSSSTARFFRPRVGKAATVAFNLWFGKCDIRPIRRSFKARKTAAQSISASTDTKVTMSVEDWDHFNVFDLTNSRLRMDNVFGSVASAQHQSLWFVQAQVAWGIAGSLYSIETQLRKLNSAGSFIEMVGESSIHRDADQVHVQQVGGLVELAGNESIELWCRHTSSAAFNVLGTSTLTGDFCWIAGHEMMP